MVRSFLVAIALLVAVFPASITANTEPSLPSDASSFIVPFVPNGERYGDTGPWYGTVLLQNPGEAPITVEVWTLSNEILTSVTVTPHSQAAVPATRLFGSCREYRTTVRNHQVDGRDVIVLPTAGLAIDEVLIPPFTVNVDYTWSALAGELQIDWSLPGWEPSGPYDIVVRDCPSGQALRLVLSSQASPAPPTAEACVTETVATELAALKGVLDSADAVVLPPGIGRPDAVAVRYGTRYEGSLGLGDPTALDTTQRWQATVSGGAITIQWGAAPVDDDGGIPTGARYSVILYSQRTRCPEPRFAAALLLTAGAPFEPGRVGAAVHLVSSLPVQRVVPHDGWVVLPLVQRNNGWTSVLHLGHSEARFACPVTVELRDDRGRLSWNGSRTLNPEEIWHLDLRDLLLPSEWVGSAWVRSSCGPVASADRIHPKRALALSVAGVTPTPSPQEIAVPLVYANHNGWNTGIAVTNLDRQSVTVDLVFFDPQGGMLRQERHTVPAQGQKVVYRPDIPAGLTGLATLHIRASGAIGVLGDAVRDDPARPQALTLPAVEPARTGAMLLLPGVSAPDPGAEGARTGLSLANLSFSHQEAHIELWPDGGAVPLRLTLALPPNGLGVAYLPDTLAGRGIVGTAVAWGTGNLVASGTTVVPLASGDGAWSLPMIASWQAPLAAVRILPSWDGIGPAADLAVSASGATGMPLLLIVQGEGVDVSSDAACTMSDPWSATGAGTVFAQAFVCAIDPTGDPLMRVQLWWDRGPSSGALDPGDLLIEERSLVVPR